MKQTAVEWIINELRQLSHSLEAHLGTGDIRVTQGMIDEFEEQAKQMEKQQSYSVEDLECAWNSSDQNMRFQFSSSAYKAITFKQWFEQFKKKS